MSAVILILAHKPILSRNEAISLLQCTKVFRSREIRLVCPKGLDTSQYIDLAPKLEIDYIPRQWQSTYSAFNRLKISPFLYKKYSRFGFILFYELDAFVFEDKLKYWCSQPYDYIGAPWFEGFARCTESSPFIGVGNGGFSLRRVQSHLKVLRSLAYVKAPAKLWSDYRAHSLTFGDLVKNLTFKNNTFWWLNDWADNEDMFWGLQVPRICQWFRVAPVEKAYRFSMELNGRRLLQLSGGKLPFGCHAWWKYDYDLWSRHICDFGYSPEDPRAPSIVL